MTPRRLLTVGHSYVVALNRRLAHEMARVGAGRWEVTVAAPRFMHGDLRPITLEPFPGEACRLVPVSAYCTRRAHFMLYGQTLKRLVRQPWDLVHCWEEPYVFAGLQLARWAKRTRLVYYTFQNISKRYPPPFNWIERHTMRQATAWIAAGNIVQATLQNRPGYTSKPCRVLPLGVDIHAFRPERAARVGIRSSLGWSEQGPPVVGYLGRFIPEKGLSVLTTAFDTLKTPWRALFVGGGVLEEGLRKWSERYSDDRVRVVTGVPHDAVPRYLNAMDVLAAPSQTTSRWKEQLGRMLIEAMACGVPVVGSDSGEIPYVIADAGRVVPEGDPIAWAKVLEELLESPELRAELGAYGLHRAESTFAWPVIARQHLEFFDELLATRPENIPTL